MDKYYPEWFHVDVIIAAWNLQELRMSYSTV